jgi:hypothetical protein
LRASPDAGCGEVDVDGDSYGCWLLGLRSTDCGGLKELPEAIAELRDGVAEGEQAVKQDGAGEM